MTNFKDKVIYQIYPKSFYDSDGNGRGDFQGVIQKLDYLAYLGVDYIWFNACFLSPQNDNGYDVEDYYKIDPQYGTMEDFEQLCKEAKKRKINIMLDMVFNHTSTQHEWFQKALKGDEKYKNYYFFRKGTFDGKSPTNWESKFGGNAWQYVEQLDEYYLHLFDKTQADLNWDNPEVREEMIKVVNFWIRKGVEGFRFDVVNLISKPNVFEDDFEGDGRRFYTDGPHVHEYLRELNRKSFGKYPDSITVGEMSSTTLESCVAYAGENSNQLTMVFNFHHLKVDYRNKQKWSLKPFDFKELKHLFFTWQSGMQEHQAWNALFWCNHDQPRAVSRFGNDQVYHKQSAKMLATALHMLRGIPYIYQGEEIGMTNAYFDDIEQYRDVESLNYYRILKEKGYNEKEIFEILAARSRDNARTPMQWDATQHAGFTKGEPWIDCILNYQHINVEQSIKDEDSILHYYRALIQLRKKYPVIQEGTFVPYLEDHDQIFAYQRVFKDEEVLVLTNFYEQEAHIQLADIAGYTIVLSNYPKSKMEESLTLRAYEAMVCYRKREIKKER